MSRRDDERVADIRDAASEIGEGIGLGRDAWDKDRIRQLAVERLLEVPKAEGEGKALRDLYSSRARKADGFTALSSCSSPMSLTCRYVFRGGIRGRRRPLCVRALGAGDRVTHGRPRTAAPSRPSPPLYGL